MRSSAFTTAFAIALLSAALTACSGSKHAQPTAAVALPAVQYERSVCPVGGPGDQQLECGYLTVPENRTRGDTRTIRLAAAVMKSTSATPAKDPILYLSGGPGDPALAGNMQAFDDGFAEPFQRQRDLVFFDQRGTGYSTPTLTCSEVTDATAGALATNLRNQQQTTARAAALTACHDRLAGDVDFAGYSSVESAHDVADLMQALGYEQYNLYGVSYGTRLALEVMRQHPEHVRAGVLDSTVPPDRPGDATLAGSFQRALDVLIAGCKADAKCNAAYPDLEASYFRLVGKANEQPITVEPTNPSTGAKARVVVNGDRILAGTFQALYDTGLIPLLPFAEQQISNGNTALLTQLAQQVAFVADAVAQGMQVAVNCNDVTMSLTQAIVEQETSGVRGEIVASHIGITDADDLKTQQELCRSFGITTTDPAQLQPVTSDIPSLIFAGEYDPITPPDDGREAATTLSHSFFFQFAGSGHGELFGRHDCAIAIAAAFFDDPSAEPGSSCLASIGAPAFLAP